MENGERISVSKDKLKEYLSSLYKVDAEILRISELGGREEHIKELKGFGYGVPYLIEFKVGDETKRAVLETIRPYGFGHDHFSDRAHVLIWQHSAFNKLPCHVHSVDVGAFTVDGCLKSVGDCREFFILTDLVEGQLYHRDLDRIKEEGQLTELDRKRCLALSDYLVKIHETKKNEPELYTRRIRELVGHSECIFGLTDSYPPRLDYISEKDFLEIEKKCLEWRWRLKRFTHRLSQVHGDYHPWNIMFRKETDLTVLDRSRGEWGEPADDVSALTINYIFYSLQTCGELAEPFETLFNLFWKNYLNKTGDQEILTMIQPFYAWRGLVIASPIWYPHLPMNLREKIFSFIRNILEAKKFEPENVNSYIGM